jgi:hypothetical protein
VGLSPLYCGHFCPIVLAPDDRWGWLWSNWWNEDWQGKPKYSEKTCPSATLSTTNPTWPDLGSNPDRRGGKPATNRLSYGAANHPLLLCIWWLNLFISKYQNINCKWMERSQFCFFVRLRFIGHKRISDVNVKLSLCLFNLIPRYEDEWGVEVWLHAFFPSALDWKWVVTFKLRSL